MKSTFVMFKPDALERGLDGQLLDAFKSRGFQVLRSKQVVVDEALILKHYAEVIQRVPIPDFADRIRKAFVGQAVTILQLVNGKETVVADVRNLVGATDPAKADPATLRGRYGNDTMERSVNEKRMLNNLIHASDSDEAARKELDLWFGENERGCNE